MQKTRPKLSPEEIAQAVRDYRDEHWDSSLPPNEAYKKYMEGIDVEFWKNLTKKNHQ